MLATLSALWGGSFFFVEVALAGFPPFTIVAMRVGLAAVALWLFAFSIGLRVPRCIHVWAAFFGMGVLNNVLPFSLIVWGQTEIASGLASIFNATTPLFTVVVAGTLLPDERISVLKIMGLIAGLGGVVVMVGPGTLKGIGVHTLAELAILGAALSYAFAGVFGRRFRFMGISPVVAAAGQVTASSIVLAPLTLLVDQPFSLPMPDGHVWLAVLGLALPSTSVAYVLYFRILATAGATNLLLVTFLIPVSAILLGWTVLGERLEIHHFIGFAFIAIGLLAIDGRIWNRWMRPRYKDAETSSGTNRSS